MGSFVQRHAGSVTEILSGFDRILFRGTHRILATARGMMNYLWEKQIRLDQFGDCSEQLTEEVRAESQQVAHGLIRRIPRTRRWMLTENGKGITTLLAAANNASVPALINIAA